MSEMSQNESDVQSKVLVRESDLPAFLREKGLNPPTSIKESTDPLEVKKIEDRSEAADVVVDARKELEQLVTDRSKIITEDKKNQEKLSDLHMRALKQSDEAWTELEAKNSELGEIFLESGGSAKVQERVSLVQELQDARDRLAKQKREISELARDIRGMSSLDKLRYADFARYSADFIRENRRLPKGVDEVVAYIASRSILSIQGEDHQETVAELEGRMSELNEQLRAYDEAEKRFSDAQTKYDDAFQKESAYGRALSSAALDASSHERELNTVVREFSTQLHNAEESLKEHWKGLSESLYREFTTDTVNGRVKKNEFSQMYIYDADSQSIVRKTAREFYKPLDANIAGTESAPTQESEENLDWTMGDLFSGYAGAELKKVVEYIRDEDDQSSPSEQLDSVASVLDRASGHAVRLSELASVHLESKKAFAQEVLENIAAERKALEEELIHQNDWLEDAYVEHGVLSEEQLARKISLYPEADAIRSLQQKIEGFIPEGAVYKPAVAELFRVLCNEDAAKSPTFDLVKRIQGLDTPFFTDKSRGSAGAVVDKLVKLLEKRDAKVQTLMEEQKEKRKKAEGQVKKLLRQAHKKLKAFDEQTNARVTEQVQTLDSHIEIFKGMTPTERLIVVNNEAEKVLGPSQIALENIKKLKRFMQDREAVIAEIAHELAPSSKEVDKLGIELTRAEDELRRVRKNNKRYPELKRRVDELKGNFENAEKIFSLTQSMVKKNKLPLEIAVPQAQLFPEGSGDIARLYNVLMYGKDRSDRDTALVENGWFESFGMEEDVRLNVDTAIYAAVKERKAELQVEEENSALTAEVTGVAKEALQVLDSLAEQMNKYVERALELDPNDFAVTLRANARLAPSIEAMGLDLIRDKVLHAVAERQKTEQLGFGGVEEAKRKTDALAEVLEVLSDEMRIPENKTALTDWSAELRQL